MIIRLPTVNGTQCFVRAMEKWGKGLIHFLFWLEETGVAPFAGSLLFFLNKLEALFAYFKW